ncbi:MAG: zinc ribbon domain-containing protein [Verrucomicrobiales bacterium]|nr:zinc ribbon domain-containing protein [Verrucomicrobiales bacterium]
MPTYDYVCKKCGHAFEFFQSMKDDRLTDCPLEECDGEVKRLLGTGAGIIFKGSGFYETDYRSDSYKKAEKADTSKSDSSSSKKEKKADKPAASTTSSSSTKSSSGSGSGTST